MKLTQGDSAKVREPSVAIWIIVHTLQKYAKSSSC